MHEYVRMYQVYSSTRIRGRRRYVYQRGRIEEYGPWPDIVVPDGLLYVVVSAHLECFIMLKRCLRCLLQLKTTLF